MCNKSCLASSVLMRDDDAIYGTSWILLICMCCFVELLMQIYIYFCIHLTLKHMYLLRSNPLPQAGHKLKQPLETF